MTLCLVAGSDAGAFHPGEGVGGVSALISLDGGVVNLPDVGADLVEEPAVVGDDEHCDATFLEVAEVACQPSDGLHVEVVGGLVEDEQVMVCQHD